MKTSGQYSRLSVHLAASVCNGVAGYRYTIRDTEGHVLQSHWLAGSESVVRIEAEALLRRLVEAA